MTATNENTTFRYLTITYLCVLKVERYTKKQRVQLKTVGMCWPKKRGETDAAMHRLVENPALLQLVSPLGAHLSTFHASSRPQSHPSIPSFNPSIHPISLSIHHSLSLNPSINHLFQLTIEPSGKSDDNVSMPDPLSMVSSQPSTHNTYRPGRPPSSISDSSDQLASAVQNSLDVSLCTISDNSALLRRYSWNV